jgi:hypothetical protein
VKDREINKLAEVIVSLKDSPSLLHAMEKNSESVLQDFSINTLALKFSSVLKEEIMKKAKDG